jgi:hypothetical protein
VAFGKIEELFCDIRWPVKRPGFASPPKPNLSTSQAIEGHSLPHYPLPLAHEKCLYCICHQALNDSTPALGTRDDKAQAKPNNTMKPLPLHLHLSALSTGSAGQSPGQAPGQKPPADGTHPPKTPLTRPGRVAALAVLAVTLGAIYALLGSGRIPEMDKPLAEFGLLLLCVATIAIGAGLFRKKGW